MSTDCTVASIRGGNAANLHQQFAADILAGLSQPVKSIPCKYIYDEKGSTLFCQIMELQEYYLTRCEIEVLHTHREIIGNYVAGENCNIVELGAGDGKKTRILIEQFRDIGLRFKYYPIDISENAVKHLSSSFTDRFPDLEMFGLVTDYFDGIRWLSRRNHGRNVALFLGSNIGNFHPVERESFLKNLWHSLSHGDFVLIGLDLKKDIDVIVRAYNDQRGVTAQFNLNVLERINRELAGEFDLRKFKYYSTWDASQGAVKSCLISTCDQTVRIEALNASFSFNAREPVHTESSYKFSIDVFSEGAEKIGFEVIENFYDEKQYFVDALWRVNKS